MDYIKLEELRVGDRAWFCPFSLSTKVDLTWQAYRVIPLVQIDQVKVSCINRLDVGITYIDTSFTPSNWEWRYGKCLESRKNFSLRSVLFRTEDDARKAISEVMDYYKSMLREFYENIEITHVSRLKD